MTEHHRTFAHIQHHELQRARQKVREYTNYEDDRIRFLLKQLSREELANNVIERYTFPYFPTSASMFKVVESFSTEIVLI